MIYPTKLLLWCSKGHKALFSLRVFSRLGSLFTQTNEKLATRIRTQQPRVLLAQLVDIF